MKTYPTPGRGTLWSALAFVLLAPFASAAPSDEQTIRKIEQDWAVALVKADTAYIESILSPDWVRTSPDGKLHTKADSMAALTSGGMRFETFKLDELKVRVSGDSAVALGLVTTQGSFDGKGFAGQSRFTDTFVKRDGKWLCVATHGSRVEKTGGDVAAAVKAEIEKHYASISRGDDGWKAQHTLSMSMFSPEFDKLMLLNSPTWLAALAARGEHTLNWKARDIEVQNFGNTAVATFYMDGSVTRKADGAVDSRPRRVSEVWVNENGRWKEAHHHDSVFAANPRSTASSTRVEPRIIARDLIAKAVQYHDSQGKWKDFDGRVRLVSNYSGQTGGNRGQNLGEEIIEIQNAKQFFQNTHTRRPGVVVVKGLRGGTVIKSVNGDTNPSESMSKQYGLTDGGIDMMRRHQLAHVAFIMEIAAAGLNVSDKVETADFNGKPVYAVSLTPKEGVHPYWSANWQVLLDRETYALRGYRKNWDENEQRGDTAALLGEFEVSGVRIPQTKIYHGKDGGYLWTDVFTRANAPSPAVSTQASLTTDERARIISEIQGTLNDYKAVALRKDLTAVKGFWSDAEQFVFAGDGTILGGAKAWYDKLDWYHQDTAKWNSWEWRKVHVEPLAPDAAAATVEFENSRNTTTGATMKVRGSWTYVFKKEAGKWRVIHSNGTHVPL